MKRFIVNLVLFMFLLSVPVSASGREDYYCHREGAPKQATSQGMITLAL